MKYSCYKLLFVASIIGLFFPFHIFAQSNVQTDKTVKCLTNRPEDPGNTRSLTWHDPPSPQSIPKYLKGNFAPGSIVYAVACIGSGAGRICGTGNATFDAEFLSTSGLAQAAANQINVTFYHTDNHDVENPKFEIDVSGDISVDAIVGGTTANSGAYEFFGVEILPHVDTNITGAGALQQATFDFAAVAGKDCAKISWTHHDPYGVVFDSMSLEPLGNVVVTIRNEANVPLVNNPVLRNNTPTTEDGVYNYLVPPGKYILTFEVPTGYQFSATPHANPNMAQVYDFIDDNDTKNHCTIYKPNEIIDEKENMPECRNIPLDPISVPPSVKDPFSILYSFEKDVDNELYRLKGKASHPLTTIVAFQNINGTGGAPMQKIELGKIESNHSGFYTLEIPLTKVLADSPIEVEFIKSSLLGVPPQARASFFKMIGALYDSLIKKVSAQTSTSQKLVLDPLPAYIEGYAYDEAQQAIPNATVQVKLKNGDSTYYETVADKNGYFYISPKNLPTTPINLEFYLNIVKPGGGKIKYRVFEFTQANKYYFTKENINLLTGEKNGVVAEPQPPEKTALEIIPLSNDDRILAQQKKTGSSRGDTLPVEGTKSVLPGVNPINQQIVLIVALILMLGIVGGVAVVMIVKKNASPPPMY
jgi:hypothetical protein